MKLLKELQKLKAVPFTHSELLSLLHKYKNPNDKIKNMVIQGEIIRIKKGLYVTSNLFRENTVSLELLANTLYGPSYISLEWALSHYGLIPERVYEVSSITTKMAKHYNTPLGQFSYTKGNKSLYPIGIVLQTNSDNTSYMIASKEKALCDKLVYTPNLGITSQKAMREYLEEDLRIDLDSLTELNLQTIEQCVQSGYKTKLLMILYKVLQDLKKAQS